MLPKKRSIPKCLLLTIVTCGIYAFYWAYRLGGEAATVGNDENMDSIAFVCALFPIGGFPLAERSFNKGCENMGFPHTNKTILYIIFGILGFGIIGLSLVSAALIQSDLNKLIDSGILGAPQTPDI